MPVTRVTTPARSEGPAALACRIVALGSVVAGVVLMLWAAPQVPYADAWRLYAKLLDSPFAAGVVSADNGHREILPNLVRWTELHAFGGSQWLGIGIGALLALTAAAIWSRAIARAGVSADARAAATLIAVLGIFWIGNERALAHAHESVRVYLIVACLLLALTRVAPDRTGARATLVAAALALTATLSFGSGIASFAAVAIVMLLARATPIAWCVWLASLVIAAVLYLGGAGPAVTGTVTIDPFGQAVLLARWLASPFVYVFWPILDPAIAARLPGAPLRAVAVTVADGYVAVFGPVQTSVWPQALIGALGLAMLSTATWRSAHAPQTTVPARRVALGVAWFGLAVGGLIALSRSGYFVEFPDQLHAPRYMPWSSLFWAGLLTATLLRQHRRSAPVLALLVAGMLVPSSLWMAGLARSMQTHAERTATAAAVGLLPDGQVLGETVVEELETAIPRLRRSGLGPYAWPEVRCLGRHVREAAIRRVETGAFEQIATGNRIGPPGRLVRFRASAPAHGRLLILDAADTLTGLALPHAESGPDTWEGWLQPQDHAVPSLTFAAVTAAPLCDL